MTPSVARCRWPARLACVGLIPRTVARRPVLGASIERIASSIAVPAAAVAIIAVGLHGSWRTHVIGVKGIGFALYFDALSAVMLGLVSLIDLVVIIYSRNYLDGNAGQGSFIK